MNKINTAARGKLYCLALALSFSLGAAFSQNNTNAAQTQTGFLIVQDGRAGATIVLPAKPRPVEIYAANELIEHVEKVSKAKLTIALEGTAAEANSTSPRIFIGRTQAFQKAVDETKIALKDWREIPLALPTTAASQDGTGALQKFPPNGFLIKTVDNALFLVGRDDAGQPLNDTVSAGTLFAAYEWIEGQLGVRWIWPGELGTRLPKSSRVMSGTWDRQGQPPLLSSKMRRMIGTSVFTPTEGGYTPEQRKQVMQEEAVWYRRNRFARAVNLDYGGHAFEAYWKRFNETHPEYFNLLPDGKRRPAINERVVAMSVGDPGFQKQVVEDWKATRSPERPWINAAENDTSGMCTCDLCMALDVPDPNLQVPWAQRLEHARTAFNAEERQWYRHLGSLSDRYARYYLAVQKLANETDPQATLIAYAYLNYRNPPLATQLNRKVVIGIIPETPGLSYLWPLNEQSYEAFDQQWTGWSKTNASLYLRPNYMISGHEQPLLFPDQIARHFKLAYQHNLIATDYDSLTSMWATQGPNLYVVTRLHWQPEWTLEQILDEYYSLFGPASKEVRSYFEFWQKRTATRGEELVRETHDPLAPNSRALFWKWSYFYSVASLVFTPADFDNGEKLLTAAKNSAKGDEMALRRIEFLEAGLKDARLVAKASEVGLKLPQTNDIDTMSKVVAAVDTHRSWMAATYPHAINFDLAAYNENRSWDRLVYNALAQGDASQKLPTQWSLRWDAEKRGQQEEWFKEPGDASLWQKIEVTSAWEKQEAGKQWRQKHRADYDGLAWYRVNFQVDPLKKGKRLSLLFGAVDESATVYLNGREVGGRQFAKPDDWKTPFSVDVTDAVKFGEENQLIVLVEDKSGLGGVWKPVWLVERKAD